MRILAIETSCDETAVCLIEARGGLTRARFAILGNALYSQVPLHAPYGGVFPSLAMREHQKNLVPLLQKVLREASDLKSKIVPSPKLWSVGDKNRSVAEAMERWIQKSKRQLKNQDVRTSTLKILNSILKREPDLLEHLLQALPDIQTEQSPDAIAVTYGPGLEPALWVGINFAQALSVLWGVPMIPINHMEGHILSALLHREEISNFPTSAEASVDRQFPIFKQMKEQHLQLPNLIQTNVVPSPVTSSQLLVTSQPSPATGYQLFIPRFPALALLVSGGHTELVLIRNWLDYKVVGETRDDAAGEAFDKVARMLGLPYPGGPAISALAEKIRNSKSQARGKSKNLNSKFELPRPMLRTPDFDFSFSGLKTAVLYLLHPNVKHRVFNKNVERSVFNRLSTSDIALEFEDAVVEVLVAKTLRAAKHFVARTVLLGGGVAANQHLRRTLTATLKRECPKTTLLLPDPSLTGDNAIMIAAAAYVRLAKLGLYSVRINPALRAQGNLRLGAQSKRAAHR